MGLGLGLALGGILVSIGRRAVLAEKFGLWTRTGLPWCFAVAELTREEDD